MAELHSLGERWAIANRHLLNARCAELERVCHPSRRLFAYLRNEAESLSGLDENQVKRLSCDAECCILQMAPPRNRAALLLGVGVDASIIAKCLALMKVQRNEGSFYQDRFPALLAAAAFGGVHDMQELLSGLEKLQMNVYPPEPGSEAARGREALREFDPWFERFPNPCSDLVWPIAYLRAVTDPSRGPAYGKRFIKIASRSPALRPGYDYWSEAWPFVAAEVC